MFILGILFTIQWIYIVKAELTDTIPDDLFRYGLLKSLMVPIVATIALILVGFNPSLSSASYLLLILLQIIIISMKPRYPLDNKHARSKGLNKTFAFSIEDQSILTTLDRVSIEMGISRENLIEKILKQWDYQNQVATGKERSLCNLPMPDSFMNPDFDKTDIK